MRFHVARHRRSHHREHRPMRSSAPVRAQARRSRVAAATRTRAPLGMQEPCACDDHRATLREQRRASNHEPRGWLLGQSVREELLPHYPAESSTIPTIEREGRELACRRWGERDHDARTAACRRQKDATFWRGSLAFTRLRMTTMRAFRP
jgi:hypothetical protein